MQYTSNYHLSKPDSDDIINPNSRVGYNDNFDTLDTTVKSVSDKANANEGNITTLQGDVTTLQGNVADLSAKTGDDIPFESGSADSISDKISILDNKFVGVESRTLLWTNPNPSSSFAKQDLIVTGLSQYDYIEIETCPTSYSPLGDERTLYTRIPPDCNSILSYISPAQSGTKLLFIARPVHFDKTPNTIHFANCYYKYNDGITTPPSNTDIYLKPYKIYGIKKVVS